MACSKSRNRETPLRPRTETSVLSLPEPVAVIVSSPSPASSVSRNAHHVCAVGFSRTEAIKRSRSLRTNGGVRLWLLRRYSISSASVGERTPPPPPLCGVLCVAVCVRGADDGGTESALGLLLGHQQPQLGLDLHRDGQLARRPAFCAPPSKAPTATPACAEARRTCQLDAASLQPRGRRKRAQAKPRLRCSSHHTPRWADEPVCSGSSPSPSCAPRAVGYFLGFFGFRF